MFNIYLIINNTRIIQETQLIHKEDILEVVIYDLYNSDLHKENQHYLAA